MHKSGKIVIILKKLAIAVLGAVLTAFGIAATNFAELGSDPATVFCDGVRNILGLQKNQLGLSVNIINLTFLIMVLLLGRKYIHVFTVLNSVLFGTFIDFGTNIYQHLGIPNYMPFKIICALIGCFLFFLGIAIIIIADIGLDPLSGLQLSIKDLTRRSYRLVRTTLDCLFLLSGFLMGGVFGPISIFETLATGFVIQKLMPSLKKVFSKCLSAKI